jgi:hypothetical protein
MMAHFQELMGRRRQCRVNWKLHMFSLQPNAPGFVLGLHASRLRDLGGLEHTPLTPSLWYLPQLQPVCDQCDTRRVTSSHRLAPLAWRMNVGRCVQLLGC